MKNIKSLLAACCIIMMVVVTTNGSTNESFTKIKTVTFTVKGVCGNCKERIEKAAMIKGVRMAEWNKEKETLKAIFSNKQTSQDEIEKAIAAIGHDTENHKAKDSIYEELPGCCKYRDGVEKH
jgi:copper chaperone CopZ